MDENEFSVGYGMNMQMIKMSNSLPNRHHESPRARETVPLPNFHIFLTKERKLLREFEKE